MVRFGCVLLFLMSVPAAGWCKAPGHEHGFKMPAKSDFREFVADGPAIQTEIAPNTRFGLGIYGLKREKSHLRPATVREIDAPKQRRAAVGFSLRF